ncbi:beta-lactamase domain-containing protein [Chroococcus sp. FPU101]|nr:beta-lactamase domain-containing protein [Chroococcus sp. FPU101]
MALPSEKLQTPTMIAIVGSGFSGSLVAAHLLKTATRPLIIKLIERQNEIGKGVAYSTETTSHLLNVSAGNMSAFPDDPSHILRWLNYNRNELEALLPDEINASTFISRKVYGYYIQSILEEAEATALSNVWLERIIDEVVAVEPDGKGAIVTLRNHSRFFADKIVLALGNTPATPFSQHSDSSDRFLRDAWSASALSDLEPNAPVLLIGTGLTMVDMVVSLHAQKHRGQIYAISRRGLSPIQHQATLPYPPFLSVETAPPTIRGLLRRVRTEIATAATQGYDWRAVLDSLRPITSQLWQNLPLDEQRRFLRHLKSYWEVHRHRIAPEIGNIVNEMLASGQLSVTAGRIRDYQALPNAVAVTVEERKTHNQVYQISRVVNCTGVEADYRRSSVPLIASLHSQGLVRPNKIGLGLDTAVNGAVIDANGQTSTLLYTIGTPRKGNLWETIAVPELRVQAQGLARQILQSLPVRVRYIPTPSVSNRKEDRSMLFRQLFDPESSNYTYLIADQQTKDAVLVDPVLEQVKRDLEILQDLGLTLRYCLETHLHADHITGAGQLRQQTGCRVMIPENAGVKSADHSLANGETLAVGTVVIEAIATPGHTYSHLSYLVNKTHLLTGDALLIRGCGRTDFQGGDAGILYDVVTQRLFTLPEETFVYPGHDYKGRTVSTIGEEKRLNPRFADHSRSQFITLMGHLKLSYPKKMKEAVPANEYCGDFIPQTNLNSTIDEAQQKTELMRLTNTEIFNDYFAMYI